MNPDQMTELATAVKASHAGTGGTVFWKDPVTGECQEVLDVDTPRNVYFHGSHMALANCHASDFHIIKPLFP